MKFSLISLIRKRPRRAFSGAAAVIFLAFLLLSGAFHREVFWASAAEDAFIPVAPFVNDDDVIALLGLNLGGRDLGFAAWANMNPSEKQTLRDQAVRIARMAQGAELDGLASSSEVALTLRWAVSSFLADTWEKKIISETDLSENAARSFYEANRPGYTDSNDKPLPFEQCMPRVREDMINAAISERLKKLISGAAD